MSDLKIQSNSASCVPVVGTSDLGANPMTSTRLVTKWLVVLLLAGTVCCGTQSLSAQQSKSSENAADHASSPVAADALGDPVPANALLRFGTLRFRPSSGVSELALSPDESVIVSVGKNLVVWDTKSGQERWRADPDSFGRESQGSRYGARPIAFSSDSTQFFTTNGPVQIAIWNISTQSQELVTIQTEENHPPHRNKTLSLDVARDAEILALGRDDGIVIFRRDGTVLYEIANNIDGPLKNDERDRLAFFGHYTSARFSPDGSKLAVVTSDRPETLRIHATETGIEQRSITLASKLVRLAFSPDGKQIVATERDSAVRLYDVESGGRIWSHVLPLNNPYENYTSAVAFSPDGNLIAAGATDHQLHLFDARTGEEVGQLTGTRWYPWTLAFTSDSKTLYSAGWDGTIRRWDVQGREQLPLPQGVHATEVISASPDGQTLAYQDDAGTIRLVQSTTGKELRQVKLTGLHFSQLQFSPDGEFLAGGGQNGDQIQVAVWNVKSGERFRFWSWPKGRDPHSQVEALCFTPDGKRLAAAVFRQSAAYVWDIVKDEQTAMLKHPEIYGLSFSPDGQTLATAGWDSIVRFWKTESSELSHEFQVSTEKNDDQQNVVVNAVPGNKRDLNQRVGDLRMYAVCYASEGDLIATAHMTGDVWIWQATTMQPLMRIPVGGFVYGAMSFSPDGLWLATGTSNGKIQLWDPLTGTRVWNGGQHQHYAYTVGFGHDSRTLVSGADEGLSYLWNLRPPEMNPSQNNLTQLWGELASEDSANAYQAMWSLLELKDRAVEFARERLKPVKSLTELKPAIQGMTEEEHQRRTRLRKILIAKDPKIELKIVARRAISLLEQIETPSAIGLLEELAAQGSDSELGQLGTHALNRHRISSP